MPRYHGEITDIMMSVFPGARDEYGKDVLLPKCLSFDRVMENRHIVSESRMLNLPVEILGQVIQHLAGSDLGNLALVNSDCQQLARSQQFKSIVLDYSFNSSLLLKKLCNEVKARASLSGPGTYLGSSIRRLTIATHPSWVRDLSFNQLQTLDPEIAEERFGRGTRAYFDAYFDSIVAALSSGSMPHLELLSWENEVFVLPKSFFMAMVRSTIQHLKLFRVKVDEMFEVLVPNDLPHRHWPLKSLDLELTWTFASAKYVGSIRPLVTSIVCLSAPTLEALKWIGGMSLSRDRHSFASFGDELQFPCLGRLTLENLRFADSSVLTILLGPSTKVRELEMDVECGPIASEFFAKRGTIETLETLSCKIVNSLEFLQENPQLSKLRISEPRSPSLLETKIIPLLAKCFHNLSSLSLTWEGRSITKNALERIGTLRGLQQLHLSSGQGFGWRHNWFVDHEAIRSNLSNLKNLRNLALSRDTYRTNFDALEDYYNDRFIEPQDDSERRIWQAVMSQPDSDFSDLETDDERENAIFDRRLKAASERIHSVRMLTEVNKYAHALPSLSWIYIGKLVFVIKEDAKGRHAAKVISKQDELSTALHRMFGLSQECGLVKSSVLPK
ncbi:hypothetical protein MMC17_006746 [Xylographa soralifera]|nr:hypothetical protein [Xylographa soralifera]